VERELEPLNKPFVDIEYDIERGVDTLAEDIFPEGRAFAVGEHPWYEYIEYFRWIVNFVFVGSPWFVWSIVLCVINLVLNILLNSWWADGNLLLVFNTGYLIMQTIMSWPLIFEIPFYLKHLRFFRLFSVTWAILYMSFYFFVVIDWVSQIYLEPTKTYEEY